MANKPLNTRIQLKHDTEAHYTLATNFSPLAGELIIYDPDSSHTSPRLKVGDGNTNVNNLPFFQSGVSNIIITSTNLSESDAITASSLSTSLQEGQFIFVILSQKMAGATNATLQFGSATAIPIYRTATTQLVAPYAAGMILGLLYHDNKLFLINGALAA